MLAEGYKYTCHQCFHKEKKPLSKYQNYTFSSGVWTPHCCLVFAPPADLTLHPEYLLKLFPQPQTHCLKCSRAQTKWLDSRKSHRSGIDWKIKFRVWALCFLGRWFLNAKHRTKMIKTIPVKTNATKAKPNKEVQHYAENSSCHISGTLSLKVDLRSF